jgi:rhomboid protease GluP
MSDEITSSPDPDLTPVAHYDTLSSANEHVLVILAMQLPCWLHQEDGYTIFAEESAASRILSELTLYDDEQRAQLTAKALPDWPTYKLGIWWAFLWIIALLAAFIWQGQNPAITDAGQNSSIAIFENGEYWRPLTAQFLHADIDHLLGNLLFGLLYSLLAARTIGAKTAWLLILSSGYLGNLMTAGIYYPEPFTSIGASTAVFGAWGLLTGCGIYNAFRLPSHEPWAQVIIPLGGGIALLSWTGLGGGDLNVDVLGHLSGFLCGGILGAITAAIKLRRL